MKAIAATALVLLATAGAVTHSAQTVSRPTLTRAISPVAQATWFAVGGDAVGELELLVLWRGTPDWFMQGAGTGGVLRLSSLTVPAQVLGDACRLRPVPDPGTRFVDVGNSRMMVPAGSLLLAPDNPWTGDNPRLLAQLRKSIDGGYALPDAPPPTSVELAEMERYYVEHVVSGYQALYETDDRRIAAHVRAIEFDDPARATERQAFGAAPGVLVRGATVVRVTGQSSSDCHRIVDAHVRVQLGGGRRP